MQFILGDINEVMAKIEQVISKVSLSVICASVVNEKVTELIQLHTQKEKLNVLRGEENLNFATNLIS